MKKSTRNTLITLVVILVIIALISVGYKNSKTEIVDANINNNIEQEMNNEINNIIDNDIEENLNEEKEEFNNKQNNTVNDNSMKKHEDITPRETKALELVKEKWVEDWGNLDDVSFNVSMQANGKYGVTVYSISTTKSIMFYIVDVDEGSVKEK